MTPPKIQPAELDKFARFVYEVSGITLDPSKGYLVESRIGSLLKAHSCENYLEICKKASEDTSKVLQGKVIDAISTNETSFFRDSSPFELLKQEILPNQIERNNGAMVVSRSINIWSAACSTGQEVYSIAMAAKDALPAFSNGRFKILGTDISDAAISKASAGKYSLFEIQRGLSQEQIDCNFHCRDESWEIMDEIRKVARFQQLNLMRPFNAVGKFDVIFCRNVAIYFSPESRADLFNRLADQLKPDGALIIGSTESLLGVSDRFDRKESDHSVFYQLRNQDCG